ncbi:MAG: amidohydrolase family protein [Ilumatobacteraceae bacterium]
MTPRIDAHHHVWDLAVRDQPWMAAEAMEPIRRSFAIGELIVEAHANGFGSGVVVQSVTEIAETEELLDLAAGTPEVAGVVGWIDLGAIDVGDQLDRLQAMASGRWLRGIRSMVQYQPDPAWLQRPAVVAGMREVAGRGLVNELLVLPHQLERVIAAVHEVPDGRFVLDHLAKPEIAEGRWDPWASDLAAVAQCANVVVKLSGLVTEANWSTWSPAILRPYVDRAICAFGPGRVLFGSDWPVCTLAASYRQIVTLVEDLIAEFSADEQAAIFGGNAAATYTLDTTLLEAS